MLRNDEQQMKNVLKEQNLYKKEIPKDGACLFRAVAELIYGTQELHLKARKICVETLIKHQETFKAFVHDLPFDHYINIMSKPNSWGGHVELVAFSLHYSVNFRVYTADGKFIDIDNSFDKTLHLCYLDGNHYDIVYPADEWLKIPRTYKNFAFEEWKAGRNRTTAADNAFSIKLK